jgi:P pilus assembly chaperone PapD
MNSQLEQQVTIMQDETPAAALQQTQQLKLLYSPQNLQQRKKSEWKNLRLAATV